MCVGDVNRVKSKALQKLMDLFGRMPSIGSRTAERMALHVARASEKEISDLLQAIQDVQSQVGYCKICFNISEGAHCAICDDPRRDQHYLCVVEQPTDLVSIERSSVFKGLYHVLQGSFSPLDGIGPGDLQIGTLMQRLRNEHCDVREVILATNPTASGEATALYLTKAIRSQCPNIVVSRIGYGVAVGSDIAYVDKSTLARSLQSRTVVSD